jgi:hypothetical protein
MNLKHVLYLHFGYNATPGDYNSCTLMNNVENAYKLRIDKETWAPGIDKKTDEITALKPDVEAFKAAVTETRGRGSGGNRMDSKARTEKYALRKYRQRLPNQKQRLLKNGSTSGVVNIRCGRCIRKLNTIQIIVVYVVMLQ